MTYIPKHPSSSTLRSEEFKQNARAALKDTQLRRNMRIAMNSLMEKRFNSLHDEEERERLRELGDHVRRHALSKLPELLEQLETNLTKQGIQVHFAETIEQANEIIVAIAKQNNAKTCVKGKSMVSEELNMNEKLEENGVTVLESDMGEYIIQLDNERPSHIIMPAIHKNAKQVGHLFEEKLHTPFSDDVNTLIQLGRNTLRQKFYEAEIGVSGVNFAIAETGTLLLIENEGNGRMSTTIPDVHIAITGIEKVVEKLQDTVPLLSLLTRSALGQPITTYVNLISGPRQKEEQDGPRSVHLILLDNGRTQAFADPELRETLKCIRCGACMNHCPVYTRIGGQAYGTVYPGPIGKIISPHLIGLNKTEDLPVASTLCGACSEVCPVKIPIPSLLRRLREEDVKSPRQYPQSVKGQGARFSYVERILWRIWRSVNTHPILYRIVGFLATRFRIFTPNIVAWSQNHSKLKPAKRTLHELARKHLRS